MSHRLHKRRVGYLAALFLTSLRAEGQYYRQVVEEPRWLTLRLDQAATGVYAESYQVTAKSAGGLSYEQSRLFVGPLIGLGLSGSVYHPNLFDYRLNLDGSLGWTEEEFRGVSKRSDTQLRYLGSFTGSAKILDNRPLNGRLFANYAHTYQDYDFFNRIYVDTWQYGGGARYSHGPLSFSGTAYQNTQDSTGYGTPLKSDSMLATVDANYGRKSGSTTLGASLNQFTRTDFGVAGSGKDYTLSAADSEDFGSRKQFHSLVNLNYNHLGYSSVPTDLYNALGNLRVEHTDRLTSQYLVNYSRSSYGNAQTDNLNGDANLRHQLYDSLTSELTLRGYRQSSSSGSDRQDSWQFGGGPGVHYVKKLSASSTLTAYESFMLLHSAIESSGGVIPVIDERHFIAAGVQGATFTLRQPHVLQNTIVVTDTAHQPPAGYVRGLDYDLIPNGQLTTIQRRTGSRMPDAVLVSYNFQASPSGAYDTLNNACGFRLDLFNHHWSVFGRLNITRNYGGENLTLQDLSDYVVGTEGTWRFLRAGVEYEIYDSSLSPFKALRFFQNFTFYPEDNSSLSLNLSESFITYQRAARDEQNYTAILRYNRGLSHHLGLNVELGASQRVGPGLDQTLAVFRPQLQYTAGKFTATIGYDFGYDEYLHTQQRVRNMAFVRLRKEF